jgi:hypothetical protein
LFADNSRIRKVKEVGGGAYIVIIPRYQEFTAVSEWFAERDVQYVEIAGNDEILVSVLAPIRWNYDLSSGSVAFETPLAASPVRKRVTLSVDVGDLTRLITQLKKRGTALEHVYDY